MAEREGEVSIYPRTNYEMTEEDLQRILDASKPVPYIVIGGHMPSSPQENANRAWEALGERMGFDHMTVMPAPGGDRFFTAVPSETKEHRADRIEKEIAMAREQARIRLTADIERLQNELKKLEAA